MELPTTEAQGTTILVGIGRDGPGSYPELELQATHLDGRRIATTLGPEPPILKDTKFAKSWELRPGETAMFLGTDCESAQELREKRRVIPNGIR